jgi:hypothetical protein
MAIKTDECCDVAKGTSVILGSTISVTQIQCRVALVDHLVEKLFGNC